MKLFGSAENKITKDKNGENVPRQQWLSTRFIVVPNKPFGTLLEISPTNHIFLKTFNSEYDEIEIWFTDHNSNPIEIEDRTNLTMVIK